MATAASVSKPTLVNNLFWQNRSFSVDIVGPGSTIQSQQNLVAMTPQLNQTTTGACPIGANYWDIGLRTDDVAAGLLNTNSNKLTIDHSIVSFDDHQQHVLTQTNPGGAGTSSLVGQYCNGARVPPENCTVSQGNQITQASCKGYNTPVGASESTGPQQLFLFNGIQPTATVDEGHNWLNLIYGPLTLSRPNLSANTASPPTPGEQMIAAGVVGPAQGAYSILALSPAQGHGTSSNAPATDFFGNARQGSGITVDIGAVQLPPPPSLKTATVTPSPLNFGSQALGAPATLDLTLSNTGNVTLTALNVGGFATPFSRVTTGVNGNCGTQLAVGASCTVRVQFSPTTTTPAAGTITLTANGWTITGAPVTVTGTGAAILSLSPTSLAFGDVPVTTTSAAQTLTLRNSTGGNRALTIVVPAPFARAGGSCGTTLASNSTCTINVTFKPAQSGTASGQVTVTSGSFSAAAALSGNGVAVQASATFTPATWSPSQARNCPGTGLGQLACALDPGQAFTLTNTGNVDLTGMTTSLGGVNKADFGIAALLTTCGNTLTVSASCRVEVQFKPLTSEPAGTKTATISVAAGAAGTLSATLTGNAQ